MLEPELYRRQKLAAILQWISFVYSTVVQVDKLAPKGDFENFANWWLNLFFKHLNIYKIIYITIQFV